METGITELTEEDGVDDATDEAEAEDTDIFDDAEDDRGTLATDEAGTTGTLAGLGIFMLARRSSARSVRLSVGYSLTAGAEDRTDDADDLLPAEDARGVASASAPSSSPERT